jgi:hypothetical protein
MKPTVAEYLRQKETVRGWLQDIDARVMLAIDWLQRAAGVSGDRAARRCLTDGRPCATHFENHARDHS